MVVLYVTAIWNQNERTWAVLLAKNERIVVTIVGNM